jgi:UDP-GlcNAc:undecaprenyl-phosphate GlcNAc-1-phosphate transferase
LPAEISAWTYLLVLAIAAGTVALLTPLAIRLGLRFGLVDQPGGRRRHVGTVARIGGLGLFPGFALATGVTLLLPITRDDPLEVTRLTGILLGLGIAWITGLLDDRFRFGALPQVAGLLLACVVAMSHKVFIELFNDPLANVPIKVDWYLMVPITIAWLLGMTSTVNVVDGLDGLATGVTAISALTLFAHMLRLGQLSVALLPLTLVGCCLGFLPYNWSPARIFLGGGAYVLGFALATLSIVSGAKVATALLILWLPIVDFAWQIYSRWKRKQAPGLGDRGHLHLRLADLGWPTSRIVALYYGVTLLLGATALLVSSRLLKLAILVGVALGIIILLAVLTRRHPAEPVSGR